MTITGFSVLVVLVSILAIIAVVGLALHLLVYRNSATPFLVWLPAGLFALIFGFFVNLNWDAAGLFQQPVGSPVQANVTHLTFLTGLTGMTDRMRVDTDKGVYFLSALAPVPNAGTVYLVTRQKAFGHATRTFICLKPATGCWPTLHDLL